ncbi:hypothetical protein ElyMa_000335700, partial [Elysia marginata]
MIILMCFTITEIARCLEKDPCNDVNAECTNRTDTVSGFSCACKMGFYKDNENTKCEEYLLWIGYNTENHTKRSDRLSTSTDELFNTLTSPYPIPFFSLSSLYVTVTDAGFIQLGGDPGQHQLSHMDILVKSRWSAWPFYIAPYWSEFQFDSHADVYFSD